MCFAAALFRAHLAYLILAAVPSAALAQSTTYQTQFELDGRREILCGGESALGNLVATALRESTSSDVAVVPCNAIRDAGQILANTFVSDVELRALVIEDNAKVLAIKGLALLDALEAIFSTVTPGHAQFPQVAGMRLEVDLRRPAGSRVVRITVNGAALEFNTTYRIAVPQTYTGFDKGTTQPAPGLSLADALANYASTQAPLKVTLFGRIKLAR